MSASGKKKPKPKGKKAPAKKPTERKAAKTKKVVKAAEEAKPKKAAPTAKKAAEKKEAPAKVAVKAVPLELGPAPGAIVASRHLDSMHQRPGRGFSFGELSSAGVPLDVAKREGLSLDIRRRSVVDGNVEALKGWFKSAGAAPKAEEPVAVAAVSKKK